MRTFDRPASTTFHNRKAQTFFVCPITLRLYCFGSNNVAAIISSQTYNAQVHSIPSDLRDQSCSFWYWWLTTADVNGNERHEQSTRNCVSLSEATAKLRLKEVSKCKPRTGLRRRRLAAGSIQAIESCAPYPLLRSIPSRAVRACTTPKMGSLGLTFEGNRVSVSTLSTQ